MANRDHSLDSLIVDSAMKEFLEKGFEKASMRKIAAGAGVTVGAIYTRYSSKDLLFRSLAEPLLGRIAEEFRSIEQLYFQVGEENVARSSLEESRAVMHLLFDDYPRALLLLCRSDGSSLEGFFGQIIDRKVELSLSFFSSQGGLPVREELLRLFIENQFNMYRSIVSRCTRPEQAKDMMNAAMLYHAAGWAALLNNEEEKK